MFETMLPIEIEIMIYKELHKLYMKDIIEEINTNLVLIENDDKISFFIGNLNKNKYYRLNIF